MARYQTQQQEIPAELIGEYRDSTEFLSDDARLRQHLAEDGYVIVRGVLDHNDVLAAREEIFTRLMEVGEIHPPALDAIASGESRRKETVGDLGAFWKSVSEGPALRQVTHGDQLREYVSRLFGEPARPQNYLFVRPGPVGRSTKLHCDFPFFAGGSDFIHTAWIPLGDVPVSDGPLVTVEASHLFSDLVQPIQQEGYNAASSAAMLQQVAYQKDATSDPLKFVRSRKTRLLTTNFQAGDVMIFGMFTMHGSLDNHSEIGRVRLSCDVRFQPASHPAVDPRYFGPNPSGAKGGSYGEMKGARPLTEPWG